jgi:ribose 5-phosphate isomerase B
MVIYLGADHRGFALKEKLKTVLTEQGYEVVDCGNTVHDPADDYIDYAQAVAERVSKQANDSRGVVVCGSGVGVDVTTNKFDGVRSVLAMANDQVYAARHDDNVNVLSLAAEFIKEEQAKEFLKVFLDTPFGTEERYAERLKKLDGIEHNTNT